jgi:hypothetical protein
MKAEKNNGVEWRAERNQKRGAAGLNTGFQDQNETCDHTRWERSIEIQLKTLPDCCYPGKMFVQQTAGLKRFP